MARKKLNWQSLLQRKKFRETLSIAKKEFKETFKNATEDPAKDPDKILTAFITGNYVTTRTAGGYYSTIWTLWFMRRALAKKGNRTYKPKSEFNFLKDYFARADEDTKHAGGIIRKPVRREAEVAADEHIHQLHVAVK